MSFTENTPEPMQPRIDPGPLPKVGWPVLYYPRPGDGMGRRNRFPALVMAVDEATGHCGLLIFRSADDLIERDYVPQRSEQNPEGWEFLDGFREVATGEFADQAEARRTAVEHFNALKFDPTAAKPLDQATQELAQTDEAAELLRKQVDDLVKQVWADQPALDKPLVEIIINLHQRVTSLEQATPKRKK